MKNGRAKELARLKELFFEYSVMSQKGSLPNFEQADFLELVDFRISEKDYEGGMDIISNANRLFPYSNELSVKEIELLICLNEPETALEKIISIEPILNNSPELQLLKVKALSQLGNTVEALHLVNQMDDRSHSLDILEVKSRLLESLQQFESLYHVLKAQIQYSDINEDTGLLDKFWFYTEVSEKHRDAIQFFDQYLETYPFAYNVWFLLGQAYQELNNYGKAIDAYEYVIAIDPTHKDAYMACAGCLIETEEYQSAIRYYNEYLTNSDEVNPGVLTHIGHCYLMLNKPKVAREILTGAIQIAPDHPSSHFLLGKSFMHDNTPHLAVESLKKSVDLDPLNEEALVTLSEAYYFSEAYVEADKSFLDAIELAPDNMSIWVKYISFLFGTDRYGDMMEAIQEASEYYRHAILDYLEVICLLAHGKRDEGEALLIQSLEKSYEEHVILFSLMPELLEDNHFLSIIAQHKPDLPE